MIEEYVLLTTRFFPGSNLSAGAEDTFPGAQLSWHPLGAPSFRPGVTRSAEMSDSLSDLLQLLLSSGL